MHIKGLIAGCLSAPTIAFTAMVSAAPVDTYFSVAITENSHNHSGENLLFLDFQERFNSALVSSQHVVSPKVVDGSISLDAKLDDWQPQQFSKLTARVMNNYPLSEFYDALPTELELASAHDSKHLYFALRFVDANHDASTNRNRWIHDGSSWHKQTHVPARPDAPAALAVNAADTLTGNESEDRVFFMFPMVDQQNNYRDGGLGCAGYCHTNLADSGDPREHIIGDEVVAMHTSIQGDLADIWHWTSTRSAPSRTLKDGHLIFAQGSDSGRKADPGKAPDIDNDQKKLKLDGGNPSGPAYVSHADYEKGLYDKLSHTTANLDEEDLLRIESGMTFALGSSVPYSINRPSTGSRGDVEVASHFDPQTNQWTLEFRRLLDTGDSEHDRIFTQGTDALPPRTERPRLGDAELGAKLYKDYKCAACHGSKGEGEFKQGHWLFPRIQRTSGGLIQKTVDIHRPKRLQALGYLRGKGVEIPTAMMPAIPMTDQDAEHIASWLQQQFIPVGQ